MKVYTAAQMREREQAAVDKGTSFDQLMENAGSSAAQDLMQRHSQAGRALIVCGKGNNGGDGLVMARYMQAQRWGMALMATCLHVFGSFGLTALGIKLAQIWK